MDSEETSAAEQQQQQQATLTIDVTGRLTGRLL